MQRHTKTFLRRNFSMVFWPALLALLCLFTVPFVFFTDSREHTRVVRGHIQSFRGSDGTPSEVKPFELKIKEDQRRFTVEMRILEQLTFAKDLRVGDEVFFTVEESKYTDYSTTEVPLMKLWSKEQEYYSSENFADIMRTNRSVATFVFFVSALGLAWLGRKLRQRYLAEKSQPELEGFDPAVLWAAKNPHLAMMLTLLVACSIVGDWLPDGYGAWMILVYLGANGWFYFWFRKNSGKIAWIKAALDFEHKRNHAKARVETVAPQHVRELAHLFKEGADVNAVDASGKTALHLVTEKNSTEAVDYLIRMGANMNLPDGKGKTPLMIAAENGFIGIVIKLTQKGADVLFKNAAGETALTCAQSRPKNDAVISQLKKSMVDAEFKLAKATADQIIATLTGGGKPPAGGSEGGKK